MKTSRKTPPKSPTPKARVIPEARVMWGCWVSLHQYFDMRLYHTNPGDSQSMQPVLVRPFATKQQAMRAKRVADMGFEAKVHFVAEHSLSRWLGKALAKRHIASNSDQWKQHLSDARAILKLLGETEDGK